MKAHTYEKAFLAACIIILLACLVALLYAAVGRELYLPGDVGRIDPARVARTPPFDEPGVYRTGPDAYRAVVVASAWRFTPAEIRVPAGAEITFTATTTDVIHGFNVERTRINMMLIPGQVTEFRHTFRAPGEHLLICHEYCGLGHHTMAGRVVVRPAGPTGSGEDGRGPGAGAVGDAPPAAGPGGARPARMDDTAGGGTNPSD